MWERDWTLDGEEWRDPEECFRVEADGYTWYGIPQARDLAAWARRTFCGIAERTLAATLGREPEAFETRGLTEWMCVRSKQWLVWKSVERYQGKGYASGEWSVDLKALEGALPAAMKETVKARVVPAPPETEPALDAAIAEAKRGSVMEPLADGYVRPELKQSYIDRFNARLAAWPRLCRGCGVEFRPAPGSKKACLRVNCDDCVNRRKDLSGGRLA